MDTPEPKTISHSEDEEDTALRIEFLFEPGKEGEPRMAYSAGISPTMMYGAAGILTLTADMNLAEQITVQRMQKQAKSRPQPLDHKRKRNN